MKECFLSLLIVCVLMLVRKEDNTQEVHVLHRCEAFLFYHHWLLLLLLMVVAAAQGIHWHVPIQNGLV